MPDLHLLAIAVHALSGIGAFIIGIVILTQPDLSRQLALGKAFLALLVSLEVFLLVAILSHVTTLSTVTRSIFGALAILGLYMLWRALQAVSSLQARPVNQAAVIDHVGFDLISLFDAFIIVSAIDLRAPGWLVAILAVGAVALGILAINSRKHRLTGYPG